MSGKIELAILNLRDEYKENYTALIQELAQSYFDEHKDLVSITVEGYTPSWNDGEPCNHYSEPYFNGEGECGDLKWVDEEPELPEDFYVDVSALDDYAEFMYGTDFRVTFRAGSIEHEDHYCEY
jgi:hypothetical protein